MSRRKGDIRSIAARVEVARTTGGPSDRGWCIRVLDDDAGIWLLEVQLSNEQFAEVLGGSVTVPATVNVDPDRIGKRLETRTERVPLTKDEAYDREHFEDNLAAAASDYQRGVGELWPGHGWRAELDRSFNHHRFNDDGYNVTFVRWVDRSVTQQGEAT